MNSRDEIEKAAQAICPCCRDNIGTLVRGVDDMGAEWWHQTSPNSARCCLASDLREQRNRQIVQE